MIIGQIKDINMDQSEVLLQIQDTQIHLLVVEADQVPRMLIRPYMVLHPH